MDIIHLAAVGLEILINKGLQRSHCQLNLGLRYSDKARVARIGVGNGVARSLALMGTGIEVQESLQNRLRLHTEEHPVDGLELQCVVVVVHHLHQRVPGGQVGPFTLRRHLFQIFIALLSGCQGVVAIAHGEQQRRRTLHAVFLLHLLPAAQGGKGVRRGINLLLRQLPAGEMTASLLEVKVIELLHGAALGGHGLDDSAVRIVNEQHHMGQLDGRVLTHPHPGRDPGENGTLRGPDEGAGTGGKVILIQIHHTNQAVADLAVGLYPLDVDQGVCQRTEDASVQIILHGRVDPGDVFIHIGLIEFCLRQNQPQGGGGVAHRFLHCLPVLRLGGKLIAGHYGPLGHIRILRQQDVCGIKAQVLEFFVHGASPFKSKSPVSLPGERRRPHRTARICQIYVK